MTRTITRGAVFGALGLAACTATRGRSETEYVKIEVEGISVSSSRLGSSLSASKIKIEPRPGAKVCDVCIEITSDTNGNGIPGDEGDAKRVVASLPGQFTGFEQSQISFRTSSRLNDAYLVVTGRPCDEKGKKRPLGSYAFSGIYPSPATVGPPSRVLAAAGPTDRPHFVELGLTGGRRPMMSITAGDLRGFPSPLRNLYAHEGSLGGRPSFLGAAVFADGYFLTWIRGVDAGRIEVPHVPLRIRRLRVVTVDRQLRIGGDFVFEDLRL